MALQGAVVRTRKKRDACRRENLQETEKPEQIKIRSGTRGEGRSEDTSGHLSWTVARGTERLVLGQALPGRSGDEGGPRPVDTTRPLERTRLERSLPGDDPISSKAANSKATLPVAITEVFFKSGCA